MKKHLIWLISLMVLCGCASTVYGPITGKKYRTNVMFDQPPAYFREVYISQHPELDETKRKKLLNGGFWVGMTKELLVELEGQPCDVNRTTYADLSGKEHIKEQMVYGPYRNYCPQGYFDSDIYYVEDGVLTSWQD